MTGKFVLEIELGNDGMRTRKDVVYALRALSADRILETKDEGGKIRDDNGNTVGKWEFVKE